jgi:hypothetical protein
MYAGGGAGGSYNGVGAGVPGAGGGGFVGQSGWTNTGGGGGGCSTLNVQGGNGGSGIVIIAVPTTFYTGTYTGSPVITTVGTYTVLTFYSSGSYTA